MGSRFVDNLKDTGYVKNLFILKFVDYLVKKFIFLQI